MKYAEDFRKLARRCCVLSKTAVDPELVDQMRLWAVDFADEADRVERRAVERDRYPVARSVTAGRNALRKYATGESRDDEKSGARKIGTTAHVVSSVKWRRRSG
jgi:hypothetical protein